MKKRRCIRKNSYGVTSIIETVIATAIIFTILALFYTSMNNLYHVHVRSDIDLQMKCDNICEIFVSSPGQSANFSLNWEDEPEGDVAINTLGFAATPTIAYGTFKDNGDTFNEPIYNLFQDGIIGSVISSCFLAGTQVITENGSYKNIEDVEVGDMVKSFDVKTGAMVNRKVTCVFHHTPDEMTKYYLVINNFLKVTPNHLLYHDDRWMFFDDISVDEVINNVPIFSVEKVFEQMPTFDLEIEQNHNYFIRFSNDPFLVHNEFDVDGPWAPTSKPAYLQNDISSFAEDYYVDYTYYDDAETEGLYEVKANYDFLYPVLDIDKINRLFSIPYDDPDNIHDTKTVLGFDSDVDPKYGIYNFNIEIIGQDGLLVPIYGAFSGDAKDIVSTTRNILIYHPPTFGSGFAGDINDVVPPYYEFGQITVRTFLGGIPPDDYNILEVSIDGGKGEVTIDDGTPVTIEDGDAIDTSIQEYSKEITLTATNTDPEGCWMFSHWSGDISSDENPKTFIINGDMSVVAHYWWMFEEPEGSRWENRKSISFGADGGPTPSYYQVLLNVSDEDIDSEIFNQLRFIDYGSGEELSYWIEETEGEFADVWVRFKDPISDDEIQAWMYYNNDDAGDVSNGAETFPIFFDNFEDDFDNWEMYGNGILEQSEDVHYGEGGFSLKKTANDDLGDGTPAGGYKEINPPVGIGLDHVLEAWTYRSDEFDGDKSNRFGLENADKEGYGLRLVYPSGITPYDPVRIEKRDPGVVPLASGGGSNQLPKNKWCFVRFEMCQGWTFNLHFYKNGYSSSSTNIISVFGLDTYLPSYSSFDRVAVHGGYDYYIDNMRIKIYTSAELNEPLDSSDYGDMQTVPPPASI